MRRGAGAVRTPGSLKTRVASSGRPDRTGSNGGAHDLRRSAGNQAVQAAAAAGVAGDATRLPHEAAIQRAFGPDHDLSTVRAHVGGAAASATRDLGASAYAFGNHVAFGSAPGLWLSAHEAAHVVQQRGGVQLASGVGQEGDAYERTADAVADRVVNDQSADDLLADVDDLATAPAVQQQKAPADPDDDPVQAAWAEDLTEWDELRVVTGTFEDRVYADRVFLLLSALPSKVKTLAAYDAYYEQSLAAGKDEWNTLDVLGDARPREEVLIENGEAFPNIWADRIEREMWGAVDVGSAQDRLADAKQAAFDLANPIAGDVWERGLPLTLDQARTVTPANVIHLTLTLASTKTAAREPIGRYARALLAWGRADAYVKFSMSYRWHLRSRIGQIRRGDLVIDREAYQELIGTSFLEFKRQLLDAAISDPDHLGKSMAALILNTPGQFYRAVGTGINYEWPAEGRAAFVDQLELVEPLIASQILPEQRIWRALLWAHERAFLSAAGREAWEAIKDNALTMLAMVVAVIIAQAIPGVNIAVDLALIVMFGLSIIDGVIKLASALEAIISARTVADMERVAAGLATVLAGAIAELFITAATWGLGKAAKYLLKVKKAEKFLKGQGNSKEAEDALRRTGGNVDEAEKVLKQRRAAERREAQRQREDARRKAYDQERERLRREKEDRQRADAEARRERAEAEAREREQRQAAEKAEREKREAAQRAEREEREAAARKAREDAEAKRRQERQEAAEQKARKREEAAERKRQAEEQAETKRKLDELDAQRRATERADLERRRADNLDKIKKEIEPEIAKHDARQKKYENDANRIEREKATADYPEQAANKRRQARNEREHRDRWQQKKNQLTGENDRITREINQTRVGPRPSQPHGGSYDEIPTAGGEVNHIPPQSVLPQRITYGRGSAIWMEKPDHLKTCSWGSGAIKPPPKYPFKTAEQWRAAQQELIKQGKFKDAVQMDIDDIRFKFGPKYDRGIEEMLKYIDRLGF